MGKGRGRGIHDDVVSGAEDKPGGDGPSAWGGAPCLCRAGYGFLLAAYDGSSASSCIRFCSAPCGGDDRLPEFPIHPTDPELSDDVCKVEAGFLTFKLPAVLSAWATILELPISIEGNE